MTVQRRQEPGEIETFPWQCSLDGPACAPGSSIYAYESEAMDEKHTQERHGGQ